MFACNTVVDTANFQHGASIAQTVRIYTCGSWICLLQNVLTGSEAHSAFYSVDTSCSFVGGKPWREAFHLSPRYQDFNFSRMVLDHYHIFVIKYQINSILMSDQTLQWILEIEPAWCTVFLSTCISFFYMFRATMCPSSGEITVFMRPLVLVILYGWLSGMQGGMKLKKKKTSVDVVHHEGVCI
jgi:hypothetical protein